MFNYRGCHGRGRGRGQGNNNKNRNNNNKSNDENVQSLIDYLPQTVIRKRRTTTPKKNLGIGQKRKFGDITELEANLFNDVEETDYLPENFELLLGPIPNSVGLYIEPLDVACHRFNKEKESNDRSKRSTNRKKNEVIFAPKEKETTSNFDSKMAITVGDNLSMGSAHVQNNGASTSYGEKIQESNSKPNPWVLYDITASIPYNLEEIMIDESLRQL